MKAISKAQVKLVRSLQLKKFRDEQHLFVAEGAKCVADLCAGFELVYCICSTDVEAALTDRIDAEKIIYATPQQIAQLSSLRTPQGIIGVFRKHSDVSIQQSALILALDGIQDPGNLGTIIRTCDWYGVRHIVCSLDTADCFNPKVVQATMGALARVQLHYIDLKTFLASLPDDLPIYGTLLDGRDMYSPGAIAPDRTRGVIIMGNEGNGISPAVRERITHPLFIPSYPKNAETSESLNVSIATAIILAEFRRLHP